MSGVWGGCARPPWRTCVSDIHDDLAEVGVGGLVAEGVGEVGEGEVLVQHRAVAGDGKAPFVVEFDIGVAEVSLAAGVGKALEEAAARAVEKAS